MKNIKVEMSCSDALEYLSFLQAVIEMTVHSNDSPSDVMVHNHIIMLQHQINQALIHQCSIDDIDEAIKYNNQIQP